MSKPAAKKGDSVKAVDQHVIQPPAPAPPVLVPHVFNGILDKNLSPDVKINNQPAATVGSIATNQPSHVPQGGTFVIPPTNMANVMMGSTTVLINNKPAARLGDPAMTCNDVPGPPMGKVVVMGPANVLIGG